MATPMMTVTLSDWGRRGYRVSLYQPSGRWNDLGFSRFEEFTRTKAGAMKLAKKLALDNNARLIE